MAHCRRMRSRARSARGLKRKSNGMDFESLAAPQAVSMDPDRIAQVNRVIDSQLETGCADGIQVVVARYGRVVVDRAAGWARHAPPVPVTPHTRFYSWSVVKAVTAMCVHLLAERRQLKLDTPVVQVWP